MREILVAIALSSLGAAAPPEEPVVDHQPVLCSLPGKNPRICAYLADDGEVRRARVYFRAERQEAFYWSEMVFDGIQYCATLPAAEKSVKAVEYYIWAIDDAFLTQRTRTFKISLVATAACEYPVFDEDPERTSQLVVYATSPKQGKSIASFDKQGIARFVPATGKK